MVLFFILLLTTCPLLWAQTATPPLQGNGTFLNPYRIYNLGNLYWIAADSERWDKHYIQVSDINASGTADWFGGEGWIPIGNSTIPFSGNYNGNNRGIHGLYINRPEDGQQGLFGNLSGAQVYELELTGVNVTGSFYAAGLAGRVSNSEITGCYISGDVNGDENVGLLAGFILNTSSIASSSVNGNVSGSHFIGGLTGYIDNSAVNSSFSEGTVNGSYNAGGLVGLIDAVTISNSYTRSEVSGIDYIGGLTGWSDVSIIEQCYSIGPVSGTGNNTGGLVGYSVDQLLISSYWNTETSNQGISSGGEGRTTAEMTFPYAANTYVDWDFVEIWGIDSGYELGGYPYLRWQPVLTVPIDLTAIAGDGVVELFWDMPDTERSSGRQRSRSFLGFNLYRNEEQINTEPLLQEYYGDTDVVNNTTYNYFVTALFEEGESGQSDHLEVTPEPSLFGGGSGTASFPWQIATAEHLDSIRQYLGTFHSNKHFQQVADIDLGIAPWNEGTGWAPIGVFFPSESRFAGHYNGGNYQISGLTIDNPGSNYQGLFGYVSNGKIINTKLAEADISGNNYVGGLAGFITANTLIDNCSVEGEINGNGQVGGLIGVSQASSTIRNSFSTGNVTGSADNTEAGGIAGRNNGSIILNSQSSAAVSGSSYLGGITGLNSNQALISNSFSEGNITASNHYAGGLVGANNSSEINKSGSTGTVSGTERVGGLTGQNEGSEINDCYSRGSVQGSGNYTGGLIGFDMNSVISNCYSTGSVTGANYVGGLIGISNSTVFNSYWDTETSGQTASSAGEGRSSIEMTFPHAANTYVDWDFEEIWSEDELSDKNNGYPYLSGISSSILFAGGSGTLEDPWQIATVEHLDNIRYFIGSAHTDRYFVQIADLDLGQIPWNVGEGWIPIGGSSIHESFCGNFNGNGFNITGLFIDNTERHYAGLFSYIFGGTIENVNLTGVDVTGGQITGSLAGYIYNSTVHNCESSGDVSGDWMTGGLTGRVSNGTISSSSFTGNVEGANYTGGLAGYIITETTVSNSFSSGTVTGERIIGGLVGAIEYDSVIIACYSSSCITATGEAGGLVGYNGEIINTDSPSSVIDSYSTGNVNCTYLINAGGLIGVNQVSSSIINSFYNYDTVMINGENRITYGAMPGDVYSDWFTDGLQLDIDDFLDPIGEHYGIGNADDFKTLLFLGLDSDLSFLLVDDIDLSSDPGFFIPRFTATLLGDNRVVSNLNLNFGNLSNIALFRQAYNATIQDLTLTNVLNTGVRYTGSLIGYGDQVEITNVHVAGIVRGNSRMGGLAGYVRNSNLTGCSSEISVTAFGDSHNRADTGGLIGLAYYSTLSESHNRGDVNGYGDNTGGLIGKGYDLDITGCSNSGSITGTGGGTGGLAGILENVTVENCFSEGVVTGEDSYTGGLIGYLFGPAEVKSSYSTSTVTGDLRVGGLIGRNSYQTLISDCYSTGSVSGTDIVGGLLGANTGYSTVTNCFSAGPVTGISETTGGLSGYSNWDFNIEFINSYWDIEASGQTDSDGGEGRMTADMTYPYGADTYLSWNFTSTWAPDVRYEVNNGYPYLGWHETVISHLPWEEDFSGITVGEIPVGWSRSGTNWGVTNSSNAGGTTPEMRFSWNPYQDGCIRLISPRILVDDNDYLQLSFLYTVEHLPYIYDLEVEISDDLENWITVWSIRPTANIYQEFEEILFYAEGWSDIYIAWTFVGISTNIDFWYIDNILLESGEFPSPDNIVISISDGMANLTWDEVTGASSYYVYTTEDPYNDDWGEPVQVVEPYYSEPAEGKRFYRIVASTGQPAALSNRGSSSRTTEIQRK